MIPIHDSDGKIIGFGGRHLESSSKSVNQTKVAKYINSRESVIFKKGLGLFGIHLAKPHIETCDEAIIVEGYLDVMTLHDNNIQNVVGSLGTALNTVQVRWDVFTCKLLRGEYMQLGPAACPMTYL